MTGVQTCALPISYIEEGKLIDFPNPLEKVAMMKRHFNLLKEDKNEHVAVLEIRTNLLYYLKGMPKSKEMKQQVCSCKTAKRIYFLQ